MAMGSEPDSGRCPRQTSDLMSCSFPWQGKSQAKPPPVVPYDVGAMNGLTPWMTNCVWWWFTLRVNGAHFHADYGGRKDERNEDVSMESSHAVMEYVDWWCINVLELSPFKPIARQDIRDVPRWGVLSCERVTEEIATWYCNLFGRDDWSISRWKRKEEISSLRMSSWRSQGRVRRLGLYGALGDELRWWWMGPSR